MTTSIATRICKDMLLGVYELSGQTMVASTATYPDGDHVCAYLTKLPDGREAFTDHGETLYRIRRCGVKVTEKREQFLDVMVARFGLEKRGDELLRPFESPNPGRSFFEFCQAIGQIACMEYETGADRATEFYAKIDYTLRLRLPRTASVHRHWNSRSVDPHKLWPVDWRIGYGDSHRHLFALQSPNRVSSIAATANFLRAKGITAPTVTLLDAGLKLGTKQVERVRQVSDRVLFDGLEENADELVNWLTAA